MNLWYQKKTLTEKAHKLGNIVGWLTIITVLSLMVIIGNLTLEACKKGIQSCQESGEICTTKLAVYERNYGSLCNDYSPLKSDWCVNYGKPGPYNTRE
jgi:hypothetical protein